MFSYWARDALVFVIGNKKKNQSIFSRLYPFMVSLEPIYFTKNVFSLSLIPTQLCHMQKQHDRRRMQVDVLDVLAPTVSTICAWSQMCQLLNMDL